MEKETIEIVKKMIEDGNLSQEIAEKYCPELKESENERIRKAILGLTYIDGIEPILDKCSITRQDIRAWLEKQGEQKSVVIPKFRVGDTIMNKRTNEIFTISDYSRLYEYYHDINHSHEIKFSEQDEWELAKQNPIEYNNDAIINHELNDYCCKIYNALHEENGGNLSFARLQHLAMDIYKWCKEQKPYGQRQECVDCQMNYAGECKGSCAMKRDEQKPAGKVEPKFKVGNWYQCTKDFFGKGVTFDKNTAYYCAKEGCLQNKYGCHIAIVKDLYDNFKLWTIQDAKAGDVLACESGWTCLFKALDNHTNTFSSYCFMDKTKWFCETGNECHTLEDKFVKAYNGEIHPATKEQRDTLIKAMTDAGFRWDAEKKELKKIEQKPAWSEEDERKISLLEALCEDQINGSTSYSTMYREMHELKDWLKSLKDRVQLQQKQEWSEEDKNELAILRGYIKSGEWSTAHISRALGIIDSIINKMTEK